MFNYTLQAGFLCDPMSAVHRNSSQLTTMIVTVSAINIVLSITATLGNALILIALYRESSLSPPSKLFLRCLALSDLCVGVLVQPIAAVSLLSAVHHRWNLCRVGELLWYSLSEMLIIFSLLALTAISVDRLLALLLTIRYRHVVTLKRVRFVAVLFLLMSIANLVLQNTHTVAFLVYNALIWLLWLMTSIYCYLRIYLTLRNLIQAQVNPQGQGNAVSSLNLSRYKKTVSIALWLFAAMMICFFPFGLILIVSISLSELSGSLVGFTFLAITLIYLNSSLNPILYYWKIRELRHSVKEIIRNLGFCKK